MEAPLGADFSMDRKEKLLKTVNHDPALVTLIEDMIYLEQELDKLRTLPKIKVDPKNTLRQKPTPAARLYKEFLQQYTNVVKLLIRATGTGEDDAESPLRDWFRKKNDR